MGINGDGAHLHTHFFGDDGNQIGHNVNLVIANHPQHDGITGGSSGTRPTCVEHTITISSKEIMRIGTTCSVYLNALRRDKAKDLIPKNRIAAFGQLVIYPSQILIDDKLIVAGKVLRGRPQRETFGTHGKMTISVFSIPIFQLQITVDNLVHIQLLGSNVDIKIGHRLVLKFFDQLHQMGIIHLNLAVLHPA